MGTDDLLADLDDVFWQHLGAAEIPALLRAIASACPEQADGVVGALAEEILNLDTAYPATAPVVPYIARLAAAGVLVRDLVILLGFIARNTQGGRGVDERAAWEAVRQELPLVVGLTGDGDPRVRYAAVWAAAQCQEVGLVLPVLRGRWTVERDPAVRVALLIACAELDPAWAGEAAVSVLGEEQPGPVGATAVLVRLAAGESWSPGFIEVLVSSYAAYLALDDPMWGTDPLSVAVEHLRERGLWKDACDLVEAALRHSAPEAGQARSSAVGLARELCREYRSAPARLLPALTGLLADPEAGPRAADLIGGFGVAAAPAADALAAAASDDVTSEASDHALAALITLGDRRATPLLARRLGDRPRVLAVLQQHEVAFDPELLSAIRERLRAASAGSLERVTLINMLASWGPAASGALPELLAVLPGDYLAAPRALAAVAGSGSDRTLAAEALRAAAADGRLEARIAAAHALWRLTGDTGPLLAQAANGLTASGPAGHAAARAITELGEDAGPILPMVMDALEHAAPYENTSDLGRLLRLATALWQLTGDADRVLPVLAAGLAHRPTADQAAAAAAPLGPAATPLTDELLGILGEPYRTASAARALLRICPDDLAHHGLSTARLADLLLTAAERDANALDALAVLAGLDLRVLDAAALGRITALAKRERRITGPNSRWADIGHDEELRTVARSLLALGAPVPPKPQGQSRGVKP